MWFSGAITRNMALGNVEGQRAQSASLEMPEVDGNDTQLGERFVIVVASEAKLLSS